MLASIPMVFDKFCGALILYRDSSAFSFASAKAYKCDLLAP